MNYLLLFDSTPQQQLLVFLGYSVVLALIQWVSVSDLACHLRGGSACFTRRVGLKQLLGYSVIFGLLALLGNVLFLMAMVMHGPASTGLDLLCVLAVMLTPVIPFSL